MNFEELVEGIPEIDQGAIERAARRQANLIKPPGSLGLLEDISVRIAGIQGTEKPHLERKAVVVFAADHGVVEEGVSAYPQEVTAQMVKNFCRKTAAINVISKTVGADVYVVDVGVAQDVNEPGVIVRKVRKGTRNFTQGPAMTEEEAVKAILAGAEVVKNLSEEGYKMFAPGDMGIGNTTASSAVISFLTGEPVEACVGRGTGISDERLKNKVRAIKKAIDINSPSLDDPVDVLAKLGGLEIAAICGAFLMGAKKRMVGVIDGLISAAGALVACSISSRVKDYLFASHLSMEPGHSIALKFLDLEPLLTLDMRLGEGTGAALAFPILEAAAATLREMLTFEEGGVSRGI